MLPPIAVILPAAGKSSRFGGKEKKPFASIESRPVWLRTAEMFVSRSEVKQVLIVVAPEDLDFFKQKYTANLAFLNIQVVVGGKERFESVENALQKLTDEIELVAVHDAVRPCTPPNVIDAVFQAAAQTGAALPGIPVADTLKEVDGSMKIQRTVPRKNLYQIQTPQVFRKSWLVEAYQKRNVITESITDDSQLIEALGHAVEVVPGSAQNLKITTKEDLFLAELYLKNRKAAAPKPRGPFDDEWMK